ncbi:unnamed protein product [Adineta ricciae]|uniref:cystathionine gamma-lyase n=1 Tax=Adineta ricciae TaxID=249248 RepID=A0A813VZ78_ADIRI|nr:unnamed protein product [Adineta ricciae]CAF1009211.1 unnamed protein product [Adineta ricciae]
MDTFCIHRDADGISDEEIKLWLNGVVPPIYLSDGEKPSINPTRQALEETLTCLDKAQQPSLTFASGLAAATSVCLSFLKKDDHAVIVDDAYSGITNLFQACLSRWSIHPSFINLSQTPSIITKHLHSNTRLVWLESPSNPSMRLVDIETIASLVHSHDSSIIVVVDNTFASPLNQSPLTLGADICLSSMTKFINGHTDVIGGCLSTNRKDLYDILKTSQSLLHMNLSPFDCYLVRRGINTLPIRMRQHMKNALQVAQFLEGHPAIDRVFYPALPSHPQHDIYKKQGGASGMCSYVLHEAADTKRFLRELKLCTVAVSLGGCETLIESPSIMTHRSTLYEAETNEKMSDQLIRMSVGLENVHDIIKDLDRALNLSMNLHTKQDAYSDRELIDKARYVMNRLDSTNAAALRTTSGEIYSGIRFRSAIDADIGAISAMINDGHQDLATIVVLRRTVNGIEMISPSENCRKLIGDLNSNAEVLMGTIEKPYRMAINDLP